jgi:hypothetical protein
VTSGVLKEKYNGFCKIRKKTLSYGSIAADKSPIGPFFRESRLGQGFTTGVRVGAEAVGTLDNSNQKFISGLT